MVVGVVRLRLVDVSQQVCDLGCLNNSCDFTLESFGQAHSSIIIRQLNQGYSRRGKEEV